ncbi:MAG: DnaJ domain-containing protein [Woeseia sp.]
MPNPNRSYYDVLHVSRDAPRAIIQGSYRTLMQKLKCHPDLGGDADNAALINKAYAVLNDPERRAAYDAQLDILKNAGSAFADAGHDEPVSAKAQRTDKAVSACVFCAQPHRHGRVADADATCVSCGSPLYAAQDHRLESEGQRAVARLEKHRGLKFYTQWPRGSAFDGETRDISLNGLRFITRQELREGQRIKIVSAVLEAVAIVTHCSHERQNWTTHCIVGVSFITLRFVNSIGGFVSEQV